MTRKAASKAPTKRKPAAKGRGVASKAATGERAARSPATNLLPDDDPRRVSDEQARAWFDEAVQALTLRIRGTLPSLSEAEARAMAEREMKATGAVHRYVSTEVAAQRLRDATVLVCLRADKKLAVEVSATTAQLTYEVEKPWWDDLDVVPGVALSETLHALLIDLEAASFVTPLLPLGVRAVLDATADVTVMRDLSLLQKNTLSALGDLIARNFKRRYLLDVLERCDWNFATAASRLRLNGSSAVRRELFALGLHEEHRAAVAAGRVRSGKRPAG